MRSILAMAATILVFPVLAGAQLQDKVALYQLVRCSKVSIHAALPPRAQFLHLESCNVQPAVVRCFVRLPLCRFCV